MTIRDTATTAEQATQSTAEPAISSTMEVTESAASTSSNELQRLRWALLVLVGGATKNLSPAAAEKFRAPADTKIAFEGTVDQDAYVYVVQVAEPGRTVTTYPLDGEVIHAKANEITRIPAKAWLVVPTQGRLLAFSSPNPLSRNEIVAALAGRDAAPGQADHKDARPADFAVFADAGDMKSFTNPTDPTNPPIAKVTSKAAVG